MQLQSYFTRRQRAPHFAAAETLVSLITRATAHIICLISRWNKVGMLLLLFNNYRRDSAVTHSAAAAAVAAI